MRVIMLWEIWICLNYMFEYFGTSKIFCPFRRNLNIFNSRENVSRNKYFANAHSLIQNICEIWIHIVCDVWNFYNFFCKDEVYFFTKIFRYDFVLYIVFYCLILNRFFRRKVGIRNLNIFNWRGNTSRETYFIEAYFRNSKSLWNLNSYCLGYLNFFNSFFGMTKYISLCIT